MPKLILEARIFQGWPAMSGYLFITEVAIHFDEDEQLEFTFDDIKSIEELNSLIENILTENEIVDFSSVSNYRLYLKKFKSFLDKE